MKFMLTFTWKPDSKTRAEGFQRFAATGGLPPKGASLLGRWTRADLSGGFDVIETDDAQALAEFALMWSDLMDLRIFPVLEDQPLGELLQRAAARPAAA
ncbi:MAG: hypothetical protein QOE68_656 [Thermoanaerobaculia bacterium]|jgi:hypothetical protein|nr:hypothetical protein [Thermoanaerobaculia bacterium]